MSFKKLLYIRIISMCFIAIVFSSCLIKGQADSFDKVVISNSEIILKISDPMMSYNGKLLEIDSGIGTMPKIIDGRTFVPVRAIIQAFGGRIEYNSIEKSILIKLNGKLLVLKPNNPNIVVSGNTYKMDTFPRIINGRTLVPVKFIAEHTGIDVKWDQETSTVTLVNAVQPLKVEVPALKDVFKDYFQIGSGGLDPDYHLGSEMHKDMLKKHYNNITPGNIFKMKALLPQLNKYDFSKADLFSDFAEKNNIKLRGHTFVWYQSTPDWFFLDSSGKTLTKEALLERMKDYIYNVAGRYKGKIYAWDVVNEVVDDKGNGLRKGQWFDIAGEEYIEKAFIYAHEADPQAKLFINEYSTEVPAKRQALYSLVKRLKEKGIPIDGVGLQTHINIKDPIVSEMEETIKLFASLGVEIHITEMDMTTYVKRTEKADSISEETLETQAKRYRDIFEMYKKYKDTIKSVTFWGLADDRHWLSSKYERKEWPLIFDSNLEPKKAFWELIKD